MNLYKGGKVEFACGDPKMGDIFMLKRNTLGGVTVNSMEDVLNCLRIWNFTYNVRLQQVC